LTGVNSCKQLTRWKIAAKSEKTVKLLPIAEFLKRFVALGPIKISPSAMIEVFFALQKILSTNLEFGKVLTSWR
jgi:hypothetical protein